VSTEKKPDAARGWQFVETLLAEEEDERFEKLSEEEQLAELRSAGARAAGDWDAAELLAIAAGHAAKGRASAVVAGGPAGPVAPKPAADLPKPPVASKPPVQGVATVVPIRRRRWPIALLIAATFLGAFGVWVLATGPEPVTRPPTDKEEAEGERELAEGSCGENDWTSCKHYLDEAATLDPNGESEPRVQRMRQELAVVMAREAGAP
jgi:hypothetical protein